MQAPARKRHPAVQEGPPGRSKLLFVAGAGRSGSTLLDGLLGQLDGFFGAGEIRYIWRRGMIEDRLCGCGQPFGRCSLWQAIVGRTLDGGAATDPSDLDAEQRRLTRIARLPVLISGAMRGRPVRTRIPLGELYAAIAEHTGARVIVDSSKLPSYGSLVQRNADVELYVLHLVRDPRATAFSWQRTRELPDVSTPRGMQTQAPAKSALLWLVWNALTELLWRRRTDRYLRLTYEELAADPVTTLDRIARFVDLQPTRLPFVGSDQALIRPTHSVAGNPSRFAHGVVAIRPDGEWAHRLPARQRRLVTALTWPLLTRYGYPLRHRSALAGNPGSPDPRGAPQCTYS